MASASDLKRACPPAENQTQAPAVEQKASKDAQSGDHQPETTQASKSEAANEKYVSSTVLIKHS
jgi:hypothetical protein